MGGISGDVKLIYATVGSAEAIKHSLKIAGVQFEDVKMDMTEFKQLNAKGPILEINGVQYKHSLPALRYVGRINDNWGFPKDPYEAAQMDELLDELSELRKKIGSAGHLGGDAMIDRRNEIADTDLPELLEKFDILLEGTGKGTVLEKGTSIVDTEIAAMVGWLQKGNIEGIPTNCLENFSSLIGCQYHLMRHKAIGRNKARAKDL